MVDPKHKFGEEIEQQLAKIVLDSEFEVAKTNQRNDTSDFESYIDLFDAIHSEKNYDWMSDIFLPEFPAHMLTQTSLDVDQYFQTRDFTEVYVMDESDEAIASAEASKELLNRTLNQKHLYHYQKFVRAKTINNIFGRCYLHCWWEQDIEKVLRGYEMDEDEFGYEFENTKKPLYDYIIKKDRFNYEVLDPRNVFTSNEYTYTLQDKQWVSIRSDTSYHKLLAEKDKNGYFNLDFIKNLNPQGKTETRAETEEPDDPQAPHDNTIADNLVKLKRFGKFWMKNGKPGIDNEGNPLDGAVLTECVITFVWADTSKFLIGFHETPYRDAKGYSYKPLIRGLCYIHPTKDGGAGDGKYAGEIQVAINDTFNMSNDRVSLATFPTFKVKKYGMEDNDSLYIEPGHPIELEEPDDLQELQISDNITGALNQIQLLKNTHSEADSIYPTTMGNMPTMASTTATAVAGAEGKSSKRSNYKMMTFENTALCDLYWMIQQMTNQFAKPETGVQLMGRKVYNFNPDKDYYYKPLSQSIEDEQSKRNKMEIWNRNMQIAIQIQHPDAVKIVNYCWLQINKLMGDEMANFADTFLDPKVPIQEPGTEQAGNDNMTGAPSNQYAIGMSGGEQDVRGGY